MFQDRKEVIRSSQLKKAGPRVRYQNKKNRLQSTKQTIERNWQNRVHKTRVDRIKVTQMYM